MKKRAHRWINGTKGAISLMLAALMLPFYSLAAILIETQRYQSSVRTLDELLGTSSVSVLANYDKYLHDRFGLLAVAQSPEENALSASLLSYLNKNQLTDIAGLDMDSVSATGLYPLANTAVLRRQIEEYGKFLVPAKVTADFGNIEDIVKELEKKATGLLNVVKLISSASSAVGAEADSIAKADELKEVSNAVQKADTAYDTKYSEWKTAVKDLIAHLATDCPDQETDADGYKTWQKTAEDLRDAADKAKDAYVSAISSLVGKLDQLEKKVDEVIAANANAITTKMDFAATAAGEMYQGSHAGDDTYKDQDKVAGALEGAVSAGTGNYGNKLDDALKSYDNDSIEAAVRQLGKEKEALENFRTDALTGTSPEPDDKTYHAAKVDSLADYSELEKVIKETESEIKKQKLWDVIDSLLKSLKSVFKIQFLYDPSLNCVLDEGFYQSNSGGLPSGKDRSDPANALPVGSAEDEARSTRYLTMIDPDVDPDNPYNDPEVAIENLIKKINQEISRLQEDGDTLKNFNGLKKWLKALADACNTVVELLSDVTKLVDLLVKQLAETLTTGLPRKILLCGYMAYNLPNRTNSLSGSTLTGYSYAKIPYGECATTEVNSLLVDPLTMISYAYGAFGGTGTKAKAFAGAELEYVIWGDTSEARNQSKEAMILFIIRTLINMIQIPANPEVATVIAASNLAAPLVAILYVLWESACDVMVLVNGGDVATVKTTPYVTVEGQVEFAKALVSLPLKKEAADKSAKEAAKADSGSTSGTGETDKTDKTDETGTGDTSTGDTSAGTETGDTGSGGSGNSSGSGGLLSKIDFLALNYTQHCLLQMILFSNTNGVLRRMTDIIQTEGSSYCVENASVSQRAGVNLAQTFDVDESFTVIRSQATGKMSQLLPIPSLSTDPVLGLDRVIYRGY